MKSSGSYGADCMTHDARSKTQEVVCHAELDSASNQLYLIRNKAQDDTFCNSASSDKHKEPVFLHASCVMRHASYNPEGLRL